MSRPITASHPVFRRELRRKGVHLLALSIPLGMAFLEKVPSVVLLTALAGCAVAADVIRARHYRFGMFIRRTFGSMMRPNELPPHGGPIVFNGATWVLVCAWILALVFPLYIAAAALAMFMLADAAAAIIGLMVGSNHWPGSHRTVEGSLAFFIVGLVVMLIMPGIPFDIAIVCVIAATAAEALPRPLNDNLRVPLVAAVVIAVLLIVSPGESVSFFFAA